MSALDRLEAERVTHGRHCSCGVCAREDWARITAPCGMHGTGCPAEYAPLALAALDAEGGERDG